MGTRKEIEFGDLTAAKRKYGGQNNKKWEIHIKGIPLDVGIAQVKRDPKSLNIYSLGHVANVAMPMDKTSPEYAKFQEMKAKKGKSDKVKEQDRIRVPNRGFCFVTFKNYESAINALNELNSDNK